MCMKKVTNRAELYCTVAPLEEKVHEQKVVFNKEEK
jgi:hypothetical protein